MQTPNDDTRTPLTKQEFLEIVAESIVLRVGVPDGRGLVGLIGRGHERNNRQALISWINDNWDCANAPNARAATEVLADELVTVMMENLQC